MSIYQSTTNPSSVYLQCSCSSPGHVVRLDYDQGEQEIYLHVAADEQMPWYKRILFAFKFIFKPKLCNYGWGPEVVLHMEDIEFLTTYFILREKDIKSSMEEDSLNKK